jgi:transposase
MVTQEGFPVGYEIFPGNTFEGHTLIPVIGSFIKKHAIRNFIVVADAAMISAQNLAALMAENIQYIVGARLGNISTELLEKIDSQLSRTDGNIIRFKTDNGDHLICS